MLPSHTSSPPGRKTICRPAECFQLCLCPLWRPVELSWARCRLQSPLPTAGGRRHSLNRVPSRPPRVFSFGTKTKDGTKLRLLLRIRAPLFNLKWGSYFLLTMLICGMHPFRHQIRSSNYFCIQYIGVGSCRNCTWSQYRIIWYQQKVNIRHAWNRRCVNRQVHC